VSWWQAEKIALSSACPEAAGAFAFSVGHLALSHRTAFCKWQCQTVCFGMDAKQLPLRVLLHKFHGIVGGDVQRLATFLHGLAEVNQISG
jgi:hypothetical protein